MAKEFFNLHQQLGETVSYVLGQSTRTVSGRLFHARSSKIKRSFEGISQVEDVTILRALSVNDAFLEEICEMKSLVYLDIGYPVTAVDLSGLKNLQNLKALRLEAVRKATDFKFLQSMTHLETLYLEHVKHLPSLELFSNMHHLKRLGVEGSMHTKAKVETLEPLAGLKGLEELYMSSVQLKDKQLTYLQNCPNLRVLQCARFAPKKSFEQLRAAMPNLQCSWCDKWEI